MTDVLYIAWRYLAFNRWKTGILIAAITVIFFLPLALLFCWGIGWGMGGAWAAYNGLMLGRFLTLWPRYRGEAWVRTFVR